MSNYFRLLPSESNITICGNRDFDDISSSGCVVDSANVTQFSIATINSSAFAISGRRGFGKLTVCGIIVGIKAIVIGIPSHIDVCVSLVSRQVGCYSSSLGSTHISNVSSLTALLQLTVENWDAYGHQHGGLTISSMKSVGNWRAITAHTPFSLFPPLLRSFHPYAKAQGKLGSILGIVCSDQIFFQEVLVLRFLKLPVDFSSRLRIIEVGFSYFPAL